MATDPKVPVTRLQESDVLLYRGRSTIAKLIRLFDGTEVNHAGLFRADLTVVEALGRGIERRSIIQSAANNHWVLSTRLAQYPDRMSPVAAVADRFLARPNRYGYEQILLLAFIALPRRLPVTRLLAPLLRKVFDSAATFVANLTQRGREPLICSELVFPCYREAVPGDRDPYELRIAGASPVARSRAAGARTRIGAAPQQRAGSKERLRSGTRIDRGSLLDQLLHGDGDRPAAGRSTGVGPRRLARAETRGVDALGEAYLRSVRARPHAVAGDTLAVSTVEPELLRFAAAIARSQRRVRSLRARTAAVSMSRSQAARALEVAADFVTPGDLLKSPSLTAIGRLDLSARSLRPFRNR